MEFGIRFTSHPDAVHARVTDEIVQAERLGYDTTWTTEHHFATSYGISRQRQAAAGS